VGLRQQPHHGSGVCRSAGKDKLTKSMAKSMAKRLQQRTGRNIAAYECRACRHWHVGAIRRFRPYE
jgi:hypothetical protein